MGCTDEGDGVYREARPTPTEKDRERATTIVKACHNPKHEYLCPCWEAATLQALAEAREEGRREEAAIWQRRWDAVRQQQGDLWRKVQDALAASHRLDGVLCEQYLEIEGEARRER